MYQKVFLRVRHDSYTPTFLVFLFSRIILEFIPVVRLTQTTPPTFPELSQGVFERSSPHPGSSSDDYEGLLTSTVTPQNPEFLYDLDPPPRNRSRRSPAVMNPYLSSNRYASYVEDPSPNLGGSSSDPGGAGAAAGNDVATTVSAVLAVIRKLEGAGRHHCWDQQAPSDPAGTDVRSHFPPIGLSSVSHNFIFLMKQRNNNIKKNANPFNR